MYKFQLPDMLEKKVEYMKRRARKVKPSIPAMKITGLNNFLPNMQNTNPIAIRTAANIYSYLDKKAQIAFTERTGHPAKDFIWTNFTQGSPVSNKEGSVVYPIVELQIISMLTES